MLNKVILTGRLTKDPELRHTTTNRVPVTGFSIAVDRPYTKDKEQEVDFFDIVAWQATAEYVARNFTQGKPISIVGRLKRTKWYDEKNKVTRYGCEVIAESVHFAGFKKDEGQAAVKSEADFAEDFDPYLEMADAA